MKKIFNSIPEHLAASFACMAGAPTQSGTPDANPRRGRRADEEGGEDTTVATKGLPYQMYEAYRQQRITYFYLSDHVTDPKYYTDMIHRLYTAQPQDIIYLHMNCAGGRLDTGVQIINAIKESEARVVAVLDSKAYSLGTLMFLAADEFVIHDNCMFMIHNYSGGVGGKGNEQVAELTATVAWFNDIAYKYYYPFLSKAEIAQVLDGKDMWMGSEEIKNRLREMVRIQNGEIEGTHADPKLKAETAAAAKKPMTKPTTLRKTAAKATPKTVEKPPAKKPAAPRKKKAAAVADGELPLVATIEVPSKGAPLRKGTRGRRAADPKP